MLSGVWLFETPWTAAHQAYLSITNSRSLLFTIRKVKYGPEAGEWEEGEEQRLTCCDFLKITLGE